MKILSTQIDLESFGGFSNEWRAVHGVYDICDDDLLIYDTVEVITRVTRECEFIKSIAPREMDDYMNDINLCRSGVTYQKPSAPIEIGDFLYNHHGWHGIFAGRIDTGLFPITVNTTHHVITSLELASFELFKELATGSRWEYNDLKIEMERLINL